jgi:hypothetical protein
MRESILARLGRDDSNIDRYLNTQRRSEPIEPERALLIALLEDAVQIYWKFAGARDREGRERSHEAKDWLFSHDTAWIFSFNNVCELLGLDPDYVRRGLRENPAMPADAARRQRGRHRRAA